MYNLVIHSDIGWLVVPSFSTLIFYEFSMTKNYANIHNLSATNHQQL